MGERWRKQLLVFVLLVVVMGALRFSGGSYGVDVLSEMKTRAAQAGITFDAESARIALPLRLVLRGVGLLIPAGSYPLPLRFESVTASLSPLQLLLGRKTATVDVSGYKGEIELQWTQRFFSQAFESRLDVRQLQIGEHPAAALFGVEGELSLNASASGALAGVRPDVPSARLSALLVNGKCRGGDTVFGIVKLPAVSDAKIKVEAEKAGDDVRLVALKLNSSLGNGDGSGAAKLNPQGRIQEGDVHFSLQLTDEGQKAVGGYLALAARSSVQSPGKSWEIAVAFRNGVPSARVTAK